jgi:DNA (cytosine-5)-methyltransferase 1
VEECRKLFGYPDGFHLPTSKTSTYRQLGNSVVVPVIDRISKAIATRYFV